MKAFDYCNIGHFFPWKIFATFGDLIPNYQKTQKGMVIKDLKLKSCLPLCIYLYGAIRQKVLKQYL